MPVLSQEAMDANMIVWQRDECGKWHHHCMACDAYVDHNHLGGKKHKRKLAWAREQQQAESVAPPPPPPPPTPPPSGTVTAPTQPPPSGTATSVVASSSCAATNGDSDVVDKVPLLPDPQHAWALMTDLSNLELPYTLREELLDFLINKWQLMHFRGAPARAMRTSRSCIMPRPPVPNPHFQ